MEYILGVERVKTCLLCTHRHFSRALGCYLHFGTLTSANPSDSDFSIQINYYAGPITCKDHNGYVMQIMKAGKILEGY